MSFEAQGTVRTSERRGGGDDELTVESFQLDGLGGLERREGDVSERSSLADEHG